MFESIIKEIDNAIDVSANNGFIKKTCVYIYIVSKHVSKNAGNIRFMRKSHQRNYGVVKVAIEISVEKKVDIRLILRKLNQLQNQINNYSYQSLLMKIIAIIGISLLLSISKLTYFSNIFYLLIGIFVLASLMLLDLDYSRKEKKLIEIYPKIAEELQQLKEEDKELYNRFKFDDNIHNSRYDRCFEISLLFYLLPIIISICGIARLIKF